MGGEGKKIFAKKIFTASPSGKYHLSISNRVCVAPSRDKEEDEERARAVERGRREEGDTAITSSVDGNGERERERERMSLLMKTTTTTKPSMKRTVTERSLRRESESRHEENARPTDESPTKMTKAFTRGDSRLPPAR